MRASTRYFFAPLIRGASRLTVLGVLLGVSLLHAAEPGAQVERTEYGRMPDGAVVDLYTLTNSHGLEARVMTLGATLLTVKSPDRQGRLDVITLHKDSLDEYLGGHPLFGSVVGRYANRIAKARFAIDGRKYRLEANARAHHIHGGKRGFQGRVWQAEAIRAPHASGVKLMLVSPDGEAGFPGTLTVTVVYTLNDDNELRIDYTAVTDKPTHVNLTNHAYWNLAGADAGGDVLKHVVHINADQYLAADRELIPTGEILPVRDTPMDFTQPRALRTRIAEIPRGHYDDCYVLNQPPREPLALAARVVDPASGRTMEVHTTQPGVQFYTGNPRGLCLETQHYPNAPNVPAFPSTLLRPGETFRATTIHRFGTDP